MKIHIEEYNNNWPNIFEDLKNRLQNKFKDRNIKIEHIGSTSIKNLISKPIIDILIGVNKSSLDKYTTPIIELGFKYIKEYEKETPKRRFFYLDTNKERFSHIHLVEKTSKWYKRHLAFRNELRSNKITRDKYECLKYKLAKREWKDGNEYSDAKTKFIRSIEKKLIY